MLSISKENKYANMSITSIFQLYEYRNKHYWTIENDNITLHSPLSLHTLKAVIQPSELFSQLFISKAIDQGLNLFVKKTFFRDIKIGDLIWKRHKDDKNAIRLGIKISEEWYIWSDYVTNTTSNTTEKDTLENICLNSKQGFNVSNHSNKTYPYYYYSFSMKNGSEHGNCMHCFHIPNYLNTHSEHKKADVYSNNNNVYVLPTYTNTKQACTYLSVLLLKDDDRGNDATLYHFNQIEVLPHNSDNKNVLSDEDIKKIWK